MNLVVQCIVKKPKLCVCKLQYNNGNNDSFDGDDDRVSEVKLPSHSFSS